MLSPRSRGKGSRRMPWRDGGRRKQKVAEWRKQALHAVDDLRLPIGETLVLTYLCPSNRSAAESIYLFDQGIAGTGIKYHAGLHGTRFWPVFAIRVATAHAMNVLAIIDQIEKRYSR